MNKKTDTGKYFPVRIVGDFEKHVEAIAAKYVTSKAGAVRLAVKRIYEQECASAEQLPRPH